MNARLLRSKMVLHGDRMLDLADALGTSKSYLGQKINGKASREFDTTEIKTIMERYSLTSDEVVEIFLT